MCPITHSIGTASEYVPSYDLQPRIAIGTQTISAPLSLGTGGLRVRDHHGSEYSLPTMSSEQSRQSPGYLSERTSPSPSFANVVIILSSLL